MKKKAGDHRPRTVLNTSESLYNEIFVSVSVLPCAYYYCFCLLIKICTTQCHKHTRTRLSLLLAGEYYTSEKYFNKRDGDQKAVDHE